MAINNPLFYFYFLSKVTLIYVFNLDISAEFIINNVENKIF